MSRSTGFPNRKTKPVITRLHLVNSPLLSNVFSLHYPINNDLNLLQAMAQSSPIAAPLSGASKRNHSMMAGNEGSGNKDQPDVLPVIQASQNIVALAMCYTSSKRLCSEQSNLVLVFMNDVHTLRNVKLLTHIFALETKVNKILVAFRHVLSEDQSKHSVNDYTIDKTAVDKFQQDVDDLIDTTVIDLQKCLGQYLFVKKYSGVGWDDEQNHATATAEFIEIFIKANGPKYTKCFKKPCPFYTKLNKMFDGLVNKATGEHVVHLGGDKRKSGKKSNALKKALAPAMEEMPMAAPGDNSEKENEVVDVDKGEGGSKGKERAVFDDKLSMSPHEKAARKWECAISNDGDDDDTPQPRLHKHQKSDSSTCSTARCNAEAGSQLMKSVETLSAAMGKPIVTLEYLSHVDKVIDILKDKNLLPPDPKGRLFRTVCQKLSGDLGLACCLIIKEDYTRRKGLLEGILEDAGVILPDDPLVPNADCTCLCLCR
ncbi:hypothetical protein DFH08DRAFT_982854 [Mycena albidolilacea]|uniref:Uncharacterized protein n=1 Tax=Mycena albidolilacea TaxID=1033008 RepID=A0AAD7F4J8_9AGAR|nr:hypothetical protein DFH08DRAFT_982854 [Mycena albidolilacea]